MAPGSRPERTLRRRDPDGRSGHAHLDPRQPVGGSSVPLRRRPRQAGRTRFAAEVGPGLSGGAHELEVVIVPPASAPEAVREAVADADLVIGDKRHKQRLDRPALDAMTRCRLVQQPAVGFDAIDHRAAAELGIPVANAAGYNRDAVADWTVMAILNLVRHGAAGDRRMRNGGWPTAGLM